MHMHVHVHVRRLQHALRRQRAVAAEARLSRLHALGAPRRALHVQLRHKLVADPGELARCVLPQSAGQVGECGRGFGWSRLSPTSPSVRACAAPRRRVYSMSHMHVYVCACAPGRLPPAVARATV